MISMGWKKALYYAWTLLAFGKSQGYTTLYSAHSFMETFCWTECGWIEIYVALVYEKTSFRSIYCILRVLTAYLVTA